MLNKRTLIIVGALLSTGLSLLTVPSIAGQINSAQTMPDMIEPSIYNDGQQFTEFEEAHRFKGCGTLEGPLPIPGEGRSGVGMEITQDRVGHYVVKRLELSGPAVENNILVGDRVLTVNGVPIDGLSMPEVVKLIRGETRTKVKLEITSGSRKRLVALIRKPIPSSHRLLP